MLQLREMDDRVRLADQLSEEVGPVILINTSRKDSRPRSSVSAVVMPAPAARGGPPVDTRAQITRRTSGTLPPPADQQEAPSA